MSAISGQDSVAGFPGIQRVDSATIREEIHSPIAKPGVKLEIEIGPGTALLASGPVVVGMTVLLGWVLLTSVGMPVYGKEMFAAAIVNVVGGVLAALPLYVGFRRGVAVIMRGALMGMAIRCAVILAGLVLALGPGWSLEKMPLVYWALGCYFPLLIVETAMVAWLCQKAQD